MRPCFAVLAAFLALQAPAAALTPPQLAIVTAGPPAPVWSWNFAATGALPPSGVTATSTNSLALIVDATGSLTTPPNELLLNNATLSTQGVAVLNQFNYMLDCAGTGSITLSGSATGSLSCGAAASIKINAPTAGTLTLTVAGTVTNAHLAAITYETSPRIGDQVAVTATAYNGARVDFGIGLHDFGTIPNLFINSSVGATQSPTTAAGTYLLSCYGTGSIVMSGTISGTLNCTPFAIGVQPASMTATATAGTATLTVSGSTTDVVFALKSFAVPRVKTGATSGTSGADTVTATAPLSTAAALGPTAAKVNLPLTTGITCTVAAAGAFSFVVNRWYVSLAVYPPGTPLSKAKCI